MCYPCSKCNKCGRIVQFGTCRKCGFVNEPDATECANCGLKFPPPPGGSMKAAKAEAAEAEGSEA